MGNDVHSGSFQQNIHDRARMLLRSRSCGNIVFMPSNLSNPSLEEETAHERNTAEPLVKSTVKSINDSLQKLPPLLHRRVQEHAARRSPHSLELINGYYLLTDCDLYVIPEDDEFVIGLSSRTYCTLRQPSW